MPAHNAALVLFGCFLVWLGLLGLDWAESILFLGAEASRGALVVVKATFAAASNVLAGVSITRLRFGKIDASLCTNAWVAGLAACRSCVRSLEDGRHAAARDQLLDAIVVELFTGMK
jgi:ammonia channel protein AmtB